MYAIVSLFFQFQRFNCLTDHHETLYIHFQGYIKLHRIYSIPKGSEPNRGRKLVLNSKPKVITMKIITKSSLRPLSNARYITANCHVISQLSATVLHNTWCILLKYRIDRYYMGILLSTATMKLFCAKDSSWILQIAVGHYYCIIFCTRFEGPITFPLLYLFYIRSFDHIIL